MAQLISPLNVIGESSSPGSGALARNLELMRQFLKPRQVILDVGANAGSTTLLARKT
jgi:hypothetical protein